MNIVKLARVQPVELFRRMMELIERLKDKRGGRDMIWTNQQHVAKRALLFNAARPIYQNNRHLLRVSDIDISRVRGDIKVHFGNGGRQAFQRELTDKINNILALAGYLEELLQAGLLIRGAKSVKGAG
ncbi:hypothetical protein OJE16_22765 [Pantoea tagorei]